MGGREGPADGALDPRGDPDLAVGLALDLASRGFLLDLLAQFVSRNLELGENRPHHVGIKQGQQQVLGVDLATIEFLGVSRGGLQQILGVFTETILDLAGPVRAGSPGAAGPVPRAGPIVAGPDSPEGVAAEELLEQAAAAPEQGLDRGRRPLAGGQPTVVDLADVQVLGLALVGDADPNGRGTHAADVA